MNDCWVMFWGYLIAGFFFGSAAYSADKRKGSEDAGIGFTLLFLFWGLFLLVVPVMAFLIAWLEWLEKTAKRPARR